ncbi:Ypt/Rab-GAP domain of gyp1p superfamily protein [Zea mays]|nr:Ypt/Rab-GAP domain of gyp1p superfamily protein [Zea mays]AQK94344.1 Ypt/Rab-GAP domain of gyp1p superfamily protein [Zea mays]AQK94349.1 Ypt/Rab-GAP domain of gyp1p superfamily protein [Zea mays]AQK94351.1 Ypt/Rab-GAP domain of gyp1p superfamily protein [Zea mays]
MMSLRIEKKQSSASKQQAKDVIHPVKVEEGKLSEDSDDEFYDVDKVDPSQEVQPSDTGNADVGSRSQEENYISKEELECLVHGGLPMALRGELWQAFVGTGARRVEGYYDNLAAEGELDNKRSDSRTSEGVHEKWIGQIEKDLPRTFPGHPALDEDGRNALRRLLIAYAKHNPSVGYCQAMNFFAGLLLLLMPEENAFWTLVGIMDDYFDGYFSEEMIESQVDQLVLEELVREKFPKLANHLDYLGLQVAWVTGPWFLSIFTNVLPWESVLRVWDVLLFDGNRVMLFRTALALLEFYGPALVTTKDAGDAVTLLQSLAGSTFDSSQLVLTARMGYQSVNETILQELSNKHRPPVISAMEERAKGLGVWTDTNGLASKLYNFKRDPEPLVSLSDSTDQLSDVGDGDTNQESDLGNMDDEYGGVIVNSEIDSLPDPKDQVAWLKLELCRLIEERRSAVLRADELETALMEMVKQDNRRQLSAKVEQFEQEISELRQALSDKQEQEQAMFQVLMRVEQELKIAEEARISAEQDAAAQRYAANVLQEKYEEAMASLAQMENRAVMAETMLEATLQYQSSQQKAMSPCPSPRPSMLDASPSQSSQNSSQEFQPRRKNLLGPFSLSWRDKNKEKPNNADDSTNTKSTNNDEMVETSNTNDEKHRETLDLNSEQRAESPKADVKMRAETPEKDNDLPGVQLVTDDLNGHHEQMQEIKLD